MTQPKKSRINLDELSPDQRERVERVLNPRNTLLGTRHRIDDVVKWKREARLAGLSWVDWVERKLNA